MAKFGKPFKVHLPGDVEAEVRALAARQNVTVSHLVRSILNERLARDGEAPANQHKELPGS